MAGTAAVPAVGATSCTWGLSNLKSTPLYRSKAPVVVFMSPMEIAPAVDPGLLIAFAPKPLTLIVTDVEVLVKFGRTSISNPTVYEVIAGEKVATITLTEPVVATKGMPLPPPDPFAAA